MDKKAKSILFQTYWSSAGWKDSDYRFTAPDDFAYAKEKGLMFEPFSISHDDCVNRMIEIVNGITRKQVAKAFLSSLSTRRLDWRSGICSYHIAKLFSSHKYEPVASGYSYTNGKKTAVHYTCNICKHVKYGVIGNEYYRNEDLNVLNFERIKWGGVRHGDLLYMLFDLEQFIKEPIPEPTQTDIAIFKHILHAAGSCKQGDYPSVLRDKLKDIPNFKSNKAERAVIIEILACIGVLKPKSYQRPTAGKHDWRFVEYWRGEDGYDWEIVRTYFGTYLQEMNYRKARMEDAAAVTDIVQKTKAEIYPKYYPKEVVDFFGQLHCYEHIAADIQKQKVYVLEAGGVLVGTGSYEGNHITRVYVLPQYQKKGYGRYILQALEKEIAAQQNRIFLEASLPARKFYENNGYKTVKHEEWKCENDVVLVYDLMEKVIKEESAMHYDDEKDYIMRMIKETARILFSLILGKHYVQMELPEENSYDVSREKLEEYETMVDDGKINEAENVLLENLDYANREETAAAVLFYQYIGEKGDAFLHEHNYSLEEVYDGLKMLAERTGYKEVCRILKPEYQTEDEM